MIHSRVSLPVLTFEQSQNTMSRMVLEAGRQFPATALRVVNQIPDLFAAHLPADRGFARAGGAQGPFTVPSTSDCHGCSDENSIGRTPAGPNCLHSPEPSIFQRTPPLLLTLLPLARLCEHRQFCACYCCSHGDATQIVLDSCARGKSCLSTKLPHMRL
jgi:hypothetical protein